MILMTRLDLSYVLVTATVGLGLFFGGRWSAPTPAAKIVYVQDAPLVQPVSDPIPAPTPVTTVESLPAYTGSPQLAAPMGTIGDNLLPIKSAPPVVSAVAPHSVASAAPKMVKPVPAPMPIVLEEIPDNPYSRKKVAQTPGF